MYRPFIAIILFLFTTISQAAEVENLYQASMAVDSRDQQERTDLAPQLLHQVLLKVAGNEALLSQASLDKILSQASQFVQQYEYDKSNRFVMDVTEPDRLILTLSFDPRAVNQAIQTLGLPIWGHIRPAVLVWMAVDNAGDKSVLGLETSASALFQPLDQAADQRGLPIVMPLMDSQDQSYITFDGIWNADTTAIETASQRYDANVTLTARTTLKGDNAAIDWQAFVDGDNLQWHSEGSLQTALEKGIGYLTDYLSEQYGQVIADDTSQQHVHIQISDVRNYGDFSRIMSYLNTLAYITKVKVNNLNDEMLDLDISYAGSLDVLIRTLAVGQLLTEHITTAEGIQVYRLSP